jgi:hypothetical protein
MAEDVLAAGKMQEQRAKPTTSSIGGCGRASQQKQAADVSSGSDSVKLRPSKRLPLYPDNLTLLTAIRASG